MSPRPAVLAIIRGLAGYVLAVWNRANQTWGLPGGKIEPGETSIQALRRELIEETGLYLVGHEFASEGDWTDKDGSTRRVRLYECIVEGDPLVRQGVAWMRIEYMHRSSKFAPFYVKYLPKTREARVEPYDFQREENLNIVRVLNGIPGAAGALAPSWCSSSKLTVADRVEALGKYAQSCAKGERELSNQARAYCAQLDEIAAAIGNVPGPIDWSGLKAWSGLLEKPVTQKVTALVAFINGRLKRITELEKALASGGGPERARLDPDPMHNPVTPRSKLVAEGIPQTPPPGGYTEVPAQPTAWVSDGGQRISLTRYTECEWRGAALEHPTKWKRNPYPGLVAAITELPGGTMYRYALFDHGERVVSGSCCHRWTAELELNRAVDAWLNENTAVT